jgi:hypothetical protein
VKETTNRPKNEKQHKGQYHPWVFNEWREKNPQPEAGSSCLHLNLVLTMKTICIGHNSQTCQFMHKNENFSKILLV